MIDFEDELRKALMRREPPEDFVQRVLAETHSAQRPAFQNFWWRFASVAALIIVLFSAGFGYREHVRRVKGEAAKQQLLTALRIAGNELRQTQMRIQKIENHEAVLQ